MTIASEWVSDLVDGDDTRAYVSQPGTAAQVPGVSVITQACGVNRYIRGVTERLSTAGYVAVAPALYHRLGFNPLLRDPDGDPRHREMPGGVHLAPGVRVPVA